MRSARALYRLCVVNGSLEEERVRLVVDRAIRSGHRGALAVLSQFERLVRLDRDRHRARVVSAVPLSDSARAALAARIAGIYGDDVQMAFTEDPALIGGVRLQVGSDVYDGSVRARLAAIAARL
jgi:F-type H+-transporting ATPase subunit delta